MQPEIKNTKARTITHLKKMEINFEGMSHFLQYIKD